MLTLLSLLQSRRDWPGALLSERLEVSSRTVRRDVDRLRELGYQIRAIKGPDGGYRLDAGSELPPLLFDDEQAVALAVALRTAAVSGGGVDEAALRALTTVRQVMPARLRHRIDAVEVTVVPFVGEGASSPVDPSVLVAISLAVREHAVLRFDYASDSEGAPPRRVEPHALVTRGGRWYLVSWEPDRKAWRTYRVDRMTPRIPTGPRFVPREIPGGDVAAFVAARFAGSSETDQWPCRGSVEVRAEARTMAPFVPDGAVEDLGDGRCRVSLGSWSWMGLAASVARFDADVDAVEPAELAEAFATLSRRLGDASIARRFSAAKAKNPR